MERQANILRGRAKKMMYAEYETTEPRLRRVLGHCAVYHFASYIIETEEMIVARLEEPCYTEEDQGWSSSSSEEDDDQEASHRCHPAGGEETTAQGIDIDQFPIVVGESIIDSVCEDIGLVSLHEREAELTASAKDIEHATRANQRRPDLPNPLRSHPPVPTQTKALTASSEERSKTVKRTPEMADDHTNKMILRMARAVYKVLIKLHPKSPWMAALEEGDLEAQRWLEKAIFAAGPKQEVSSLRCSGGVSSSAWIGRQPIK